MTCGMLCVMGRERRGVLHLDKYSPPKANWCVCVWGGGGGGGGGEGERKREKEKEKERRKRTERKENQQFSD